MFWKAITFLIYSRFSLFVANLKLLNNYKLLFLQITRRRSNFLRRTRIDESWIVDEFSFFSSSQTLFEKISFPNYSNLFYLLETMMFSNSFYTLAQVMIF